jgi:hypothetical protein
MDKAGGRHVNPRRPPAPSWGLVEPVYETTAGSADLDS